MTNTRALLAAAIALSGIPAFCAPAKPPPAEVVEKPYLYEIARHLYRWHLDESDVERLDEAKTFPFWVRRLDPQLDEGDRSEFAEIVLPLLDARVKVKKADYRIGETGAEVKSEKFRIVNVARGDLPAAPGADDTVVDADWQAMRAYLFETRTKAEFPHDALFERLRRALRRQLGRDEESRDAGRQIIHLAPMSPVANELWVFWETRKLLLRFSSDIDLSDPSVWEHETLGLRTFDVLNQVVVSLGEAAGSNAFMTRDQIGRALYNCIVLGRRLEADNPAVPEPGPAGAPPAP
jgi:hypothetical protein